MAVIARPYFGKSLWLPLMGVQGNASRLIHVVTEENLPVLTIVACQGDVVQEGISPVQQFRQPVYGNACQINQPPPFISLQRRIPIS